MKIIEIAMLKAKHVALWLRHAGSKGCFQSPASSLMSIPNTKCCVPPRRMDKLHLLGRDAMLLTVLIFMRPLRMDYDAKRSVKFPLKQSAGSP